MQIVKSFYFMIALSVAPCAYVFSQTCLTKISVTPAQKLTHITLSFTQPCTVTSTMFDRTTSQLTIALAQANIYCPEPIISSDTLAKLNEFGITSYRFIRNESQQTLDWIMLCKPTLKAIAFWYTWCNIDHDKTDYRLELELYNQAFLDSIQDPLHETATVGQLPTIVIDPGHGGKAKGACWYGLEEKTINLAIAHEVKKLLDESGYTTLMTRYDDSDVSLDERAQVAINQSNALFVSIHANATTIPSEFLSLVHGLETYAFNSQELTSQLDSHHLIFINLPPTQQLTNNLVYLLRKNNTQSYVMATTMHQNVLTTLQHESNIPIVDRGVRAAHFRVLLLSASTTPALLIEVGYLSNQQENVYLADPGYRKQLAIGIYNGIIDYVKTTDVVINQKKGAL